jgi:class 3 adenylate cyclase/tetratricopeptide (TPR) repeat protein/ABC-type transport system involved in cytochrome c biogenesis ATPase subunit
MDIEKWLCGLGLQQYVTTFRDNAIDAEVLSELTEADLEKLGVVLGHRKRLLKAIATLVSSAALEQATPVGEAPSSGEGAQRRQLTVMFCDLVGSTALTSRLDPEDMREVIGAYHRCVAKTVARFDGFVAKYMGDGVLIYFGYPQAHEHDAERAVRAGLKLVDKVAELKPHPSVRLQLRVGVATGLAVVGDLIGSGEAQERGIVGETPNLAARLQAVAPPGSLVIGEATQRLVEGLFEIEPLAPQMLKGFSAPITIYRVLRPSTAPNRFEARSGRFLTPLIGRETELGFLSKRWEIATEGEGQAVLLQGEAGIGKSRLLQTLRMQLREMAHTEVLFYCSPQHQNSALWPAIQQLHRALGFAGEEDDATRRERLRRFLGDLDLDSADVVEPLAVLLGLSADPEWNAGQADSGQLRRAVFAALSRLTAAMQRRSPVLVVVEDAHWIDPSTTELVGQMLSDITSQRLFVLLTARPEFRAPWSNSSPMVTLPLAKLSRHETEAMIRGVAPDLPAAMLAQLVGKTDGVPLFIEELTKSVAETTSSVGSSAAIEIPATLQAALHTRLDRLAPIRQIIQVAALLGRVFDADLLIAAAQRDAAAVKQALHDLTEAELIYPRRDPHSESYQFKHALIQDAAIGTLLRNQRAQLHRQIALALSELRPDAVERNPELLAHHLQESGDWCDALDHWQKAGAAAMARAAAREAVSHFANAIDCSKRLDKVPGGAERMTRLHLAMANALMQAEGYYRSERLDQALEDARRAAADTTSVQLQCEAVFSRAPFFYATGRNRDYLTLADELLEQYADLLPQTYVSALWSQKGTAHFNRGEWRFAIEAMRKARDMIDRTDASRRILLGGADQLIPTQTYLSRSLAAMGLIDEAVEIVEGFVQTIDRMEKPFDIAWALLVKCNLFALLGHNEALLENSAKLIEISERHGYMARRGQGLSYRGLARSRLGDLDAGINDAREGMMIWRGRGVVFHTQERICWLCDLLVPAGRLDEASQLLDEADALVIGTDDVSALAESIRVRGQIAACRNNPTDAVRLFEEAIAISRRQEGRLFELRATTQLASVLAGQGRAQEGELRLRAIIDSFNTKHEFVDLPAARKVLDTLRW